MKVIIYSTPTCGFCSRAKDFFRKNKVKYKEFNVAVNSKAREDMIHKSGQLGVPVIDANGKVVVGFDEPLLRKLLKVK